jgi:hypothetical protein
MNVLAVLCCFVALGLAVSAVVPLGAKEAQEQIFTWPEVQGVVYRFVMTSDNLINLALEARVNNKTLDNNPKGTKLFLKSSSIEVHNNLNFGQLAQAFGEKRECSFENNTLKAEIPKLGNATVSITADAAVKYSFEFGDGTGDRSSYSMVQSILVNISEIMTIFTWPLFTFFKSYEEAETYRKKEDTFVQRILIEDPFVAIDFYDTRDGDRGSHFLKFQPEDFEERSEESKIEILSKINKSVEESKKIPLTIITAINKF